MSFVLSLFLGLFTKLAQIAAFEFGINIKYIQISTFDWKNEDRARNEKFPGTGASTGTDLNGHAICKLKDKFLGHLRSHIPEGGKYREIWNKHKAMGNRFYCSSTFSNADQFHEETPEADIWPIVMKILAGNNYVSEPVDGEDFSMSEYLADTGLSFSPIDSVTRQGSQLLYFTSA
jgi:hypothetical protein